MNTASIDLPRHLDVLRQKLEHSTDYEKAVFYFLEEFAGDVGFVAQSVSREAPHLLAIVQYMARKALGETAEFAPNRTWYLVGHGFYHGFGQMAGRIVVFFYFEQADVGAAALMAMGSRQNHIARFHLNNALLGGNPTTN
jgi:hypothetical protein